MRKSLLPFLMIIMISVSVYGNQHLVDSFKSELKKYTKEDVTKARIINKISYYYWAISPDSMEKYALELRKLSEKIDYQKGIGLSYQNVATANWVRGNYNKALENELKALKIYERLQDTFGLISSYQSLGNIYSDQMIFDNALKYYNQAVKLTKVVKREGSMYNLFNAIGTIHHLQQNYDMALSFYERALEYRLQVQDKRGIAESLNNIGLIYMAKDDLEKALDYQLRSIAIKEELNDKNGLAMTYENIGIIYDEMKEYKKAEEAYLNGLRIAEEIGSLKFMKDIYFNLSDNKALQHDYKNALKYRKDFARLKDSILNSERIQEFAALEGAYEKEKRQRELELKEKEILLLEKERKYSRLWHVVAAGGFFLLIAAFVLMIIMQRRRMHRIKEFLALKQARTKAELENIRLKEQELNKELEFKNKELTSYTLNFIRKKELIEELQKNIDYLKKKNGNSYRELRNLGSLIRESENLDKDWEDFKLYFEQVHKDFFSFLTQNYPDLTAGDLRLCALLKMNLNLKEASTILGISPNSVKTARYRLRKKLNLTQDEKLVEFILHLENKSALN